MKLYRRITCILAVILFLTGLFVFVTEPADARAGGGQRFQGETDYSGDNSGTSDYSSGSNGYSSGFISVHESRPSYNNDYNTYSNNDTDDEEVHGPEIIEKTPEQIAAEEALREKRYKEYEEQWQKEHDEWDKNNITLIRITIILMFAVCCVSPFRPFGEAQTDGSGCGIVALTGMFAYFVYNLHAVIPCYIYDVVAVVYLIPAIFCLLKRFIKFIFSIPSRLKDLFSSIGRYAGSSSKRVSEKKKIIEPRFNRIIDLSAFTEKDPKFSKEAFLARVKMAFMVIQECWSGNDWAKAEAFLADGTYEQFQIQINDMIANSVIDKMEKLSIEEVYVTKYEINPDYDSIYVLISAKGKNYRINSETNEFIEGDTQVEPFTEIWCFMRRTGAKTVNEKGLIEGFCPNCGTPIEGSRLSKCPSCGSQLRSGEHDWVLTGITQASEWRNTHNSNIFGLKKFRENDPEFNIQNIEDKLSVMFWRMIEANRTQSADPIRKIATNELIGIFDRKHRLANFPMLYEPAIGSIQIVSVINDDNDFQTLMAQVTWSGINEMDVSQYMKSLFVLKRGKDCRTDSRKSFTSTHCPNCGAPQKISADNMCEYCNTAVNDINKDWLLYFIYDYNSDEAKKFVGFCDPANNATSSKTKKTGNETSSKAKRKSGATKVKSAQSDNAHEIFNICRKKDYSGLESIADIDLQRLTVAMMLADGVIDRREQEKISDIFAARSGIKKKQIDRTVNTLQHVEDPIEYVIDNLAISRNLTLIKCLIDIAIADRCFSDKEKALISKVADKIGVFQSEVEEMYKEMRLN